ncbi:DHHC palmitoyltransferase-domain-containing protein [Roridomyces roridus]|uniref:Palmitoyltransferase n=1 Tax=Roridomyces roridus TaxID=1738132 RepID=A0AAD7FAC2_9AGAR|nr:DHHC palmitoyltransferase-domain-containing protein [Roridomyces roridus]
MMCSRVVFRCFKAMERFADRLTGAAGPFFVAFAIILIGLGAICFFDVVMPSLSWPLISFPICLLIVLNLFMHYYYVVTVPPGFVEDPPREPGSSIFWATKNGPPRGELTGVRWSKELVITRAAVTRCRKCGQSKPERTHHCRICNRCVLKYDHHCPVRVNQCVGLHNERHFVMFMAYLVVACICLVATGYPHILRALGATADLSWPHRVPQIAFILEYILAVVMALAVGIMVSYHLWTVAHGETTVESHDHEIYRKVARSRDETFVNSYDLGKRRNLELFFNIGENGYPLYTLILPLRINPYTDGRSWARREGYEAHSGVRRGEELTDEEDEEDEA